MTTPVEESGVPSALADLEAAKRAALQAADELAARASEGDVDGAGAASSCVPAPLSHEGPIGAEAGAEPVQADTPPGSFEGSFPAEATNASAGAEAARASAEPLRPGPDPSASAAPASEPPAVTAAAAEAAAAEEEEGDEKESPAAAAAEAEGPGSDGAAAAGKLGEHPTLVCQEPGAAHSDATSDHIQQLPTTVPCRCG